MIITITIIGDSPKMLEALRFLLEDAATFPHLDHKQYEKEIKMLNQASIEVTDAEH